MKLSVRSTELDRDNKEVEELREKLIILEYDIDQPDWMVSKEFISGKMLERLHIISKIKRKENND